MEGVVVAEAKTRRVRFTARPPARLVAGDAIIPAGGEGDLPAKLAEELAANPHVEVELLPEPEPAAKPEKEENA